MGTEREAWLKLVVEEPIEPSLPICDAHHHLYDNPDDLYLLEDFLHDIRGGHNVAQTVYVECKSWYRKDGIEELQPVGETEFVQGVAEQTARSQYKTKVGAGIVSFADLTLGDGVARVLEANMAASSRFRGIRHTSDWDASPVFFPRRKRTKGLLLDPKFREGFAYLRKYNLSFDAWLYFTQLSELLDLAKAFPDTPIVLNHVGGLLGIGPYAGRREEIFRQWKRGITALAECPNVVVKLGGLGMTICGFGWHERAKPPTSIELAEAMAPYIRWCIDRFGVKRSMFESNFPADKKSCSYVVLWNAFKRITKDFSPGERAALFHDTAARVYRLGTGR